MQGSPVDAAIALGSNLGDRAANIEVAIASLAAGPGTLLVARSTVIETAPMDPLGDGPGACSVRAAGTIAPDLGGPYLNTVVLVRTGLPPSALLDRLHAIERALGRRRTPGVRWEPRTIDLDLLLYGDRVIDDPGLRVPHPGLHRRLFVLEPLAEVAHGWTVPTLGRTVACLLEHVRTPQSVCK